MAMFEYLPAGKINAREIQVDKMTVLEDGSYVEVPSDATLTVGGTGFNKTLTIQLVDKAGNDVEKIAQIPFYLSNSSDGSDKATTTNISAVDCTTGLAFQVVSKIAYNIVTDDTGTAVVAVTGQTTADTWYAVLSMPAGNTLISGAITTTS